MIEIIYDDEIKEGCAIIKAWDFYIKTINALESVFGFKIDEPNCDVFIYDFQDNYNSIIEPKLIIQTGVRFLHEKIVVKNGQKLYAFRYRRDNLNGYCIWYANINSIKYNIYNSAKAMFENTMSDHVNKMI